MRIVVVGGSGLIGDKVMTALHKAGHKPVAASPAFEIDAFTGEGLDEAMTGAEGSSSTSPNAPGCGDEKVLEFFTTVTRNALAAGRRAGARHHVALSILGCDRLPESALPARQVAQEELIRAAQLPFTIVHSTQFMEFLARVAEAGTESDVVRDPMPRCSRSQQSKSPDSSRRWRRTRRPTTWSRSRDRTPSRLRTRSPASSMPRTIAVTSSPIPTRGTSGPSPPAAYSCRDHAPTLRPPGSPTGCHSATRTPRLLPHPPRQ